MVKVPPQAVLFDLGGVLLILLYLILLYWVVLAFAGGWLGRAWTGGCP